MIYVPDKENYKCFVVRSEEVIRAYEEIPANNREVNYRDYYYNSNYLYNDGVQSFSQYTTLPVCLDNNIITDNVYYRNDFDSILIIFIIIIGLIWFLISKLVKTFFSGFKKY